MVGKATRGFIKFGATINDDTWLYQRGRLNGPHWLRNWCVVGATCEDIPTVRFKSDGRDARRKGGPHRGIVAYLKRAIKTVQPTSIRSDDWHFSRRIPTRSWLDWTAIVAQSWCDCGTRSTRIGGPWLSCDRGHQLASYQIKRPTFLTRISFKNWWTPSFVT